MTKPSPREQLGEVEYLNPADGPNEDLLATLLLAPVALPDMPGPVARARPGRMTKICACGSTTRMCDPVDFFEFTEE